MSKEDGADTASPGSERDAARHAASPSTSGLSRASRGPWRARWTPPYAVKAVVALVRRTPLPCSDGHPPAVSLPCGLWGGSDGPVPLHVFCGAGTSSLAPNGEPAHTWSAPRLQQRRTCTLPTVSVLPTANRRLAALVHDRVKPWPALHVDLRAVCRPRRYPSIGRHTPTSLGLISGSPPFLTPGPTTL